MSKVSGTCIKSRCFADRPPVRVIKIAAVQTAAMGMEHAIFTALRAVRGEGYRRLWRLRAMRAAAPEKSGQVL